MGLLKGSLERTTVVVLCLALLVGCATPVAWWQASPDLEHCAQLYEESLAAIERSGARDASAHRLKNFPFLRVDRFLAGYSAMEMDVAQRRVWLHRMNRLALDGLILESKGALHEAEIKACGDLLVEDAASRPELLARIQSEARVPHSYEIWQRWLGIYPFTGMLFRVGVIRDQQCNRERMERFEKQQLPVTGGIYGLAGSPEKPPPWPELAVDALGVPLIPPAVRDGLFRRYAPVVVAGSDGEDDRLGTPEFSAGGVLEIDTGAPAIFAWVDFGRYRGEVTLRLNYAFWFSRRPAEGWFDLLAGRFDGLTWRVHLKPDGRIIAWDSMHNCGCWYQLYPNSGYALDQRNKPFVEPVFAVEGTGGGPGNNLYLEPSTHQLLGIDDRSLSITRPVELKPYADLKRLPGSGEGRLGMFDRRGMVPESKRLERFFFWPMGVPNSGAMRVRGTHAIAFVGIRHFDDPHLLDKIGLVPEAQR